MTRIPLGTAHRIRLRAAGFTLIELLVAVSILAILAMFAWRGLDEIVRTREALNARSDALDALRLGFASVARDLTGASAVLLDGRGGLGVEGALVAGRPQAGVEYRLVGQALERRTQVRAETYLNGLLRAWGCEVLGADGEWRATGRVADPQAVRLRLDLHAGGVVQRVFLLRQ